MKRLFFIFSFLALIYSNSFSVWDLELQSDVSVDIRMETVSIPFEGTNRPDPYVRTFEIYYGAFYRNIYFSNVKDSQIVLHQWYNVTNSDDLASCFYESNQYNYRRWGFCKYLITFKNLSDTNKTIRFYFNSLDSKCGTDSVPGYGYHQDLKISYFGNSGTPYVKVSMDRDTSRYRIVYRNTNPQEVTMWDLFYNRTSPLQKDFKVRTTPFPLSKFVAENYLRDIICGTKIVLDTVYRNLGSQDKFGYNTQNDPYYDRPPIDTTLNDKGNTFCTPAVINILPSGDYFGIKLTVTDGDTLILEKNKKLWISGISNNPPLGDTIHFKAGSTLILKESAEIFTYNGGVRIFDGGVNVNWNQHACNRAFSSTALVYNGGTHTINNGGFLVIDGGAKLILGDNTTLTFDGASSPLILQSGSQVICGSNSKIEFKNGAHLRANGCTFSSPNGSWQGISLENSTYDTIQNCTFSNAPVFINMNLNSGTRTYFKKIQNNTFNNGTVKITEATNIIFSNNTFNCQSVSGNTALLEISHLISGLPANPVLNILYNTFKGGTFQLKLNGFAASSVPYYIYKNTFEGTNSTARIGFYANQIKGSFKQNTFTDDNYQNAAWLASSNINFLANKMESKTGNTLNTTLGSTSNLAPSNNTGRSTLEWIAGYNELNLNNTNTNSANLGSLYFESGSTVLTDKGRNCFYYYNITPNYHFIGYFPGELEEAPLVNASKNHWSPSTPKTWFNVTTIFAYSPAQLNCPSWLNQETIQITGTELADMGGIYDTILISAAEEDGDGDGDGGSLSSANQDRILYYNALIDIRHKQYETALYRLKELVNDYDSSLYVLPALDYIYHSAVLSDTTMNQGSTNAIFTPLKQYYEQVITDYENNLPVVEKSYNCYLMCLVKLKSFTQAISGYENIMNNHPDPLARLKASWDRSAVVLLTGQGGSFPNILPKPSEKFNQRRLLDKKPDKVARKTFKNAEESDNDLSSGKYSEEDKLILDERALKFNPVSRKAFDEKISVDLSVILGLNSNISGDKKTGSIPERFALYQNYPNPFNPVTTIKYALPKDGLITLKVYDILGREVFSVNEFKKAGSHETVFDGLGFASGVYFYSLESNGLKETKKMLLVK